MSQFIGIVLVLLSCACQGSTEPLESETKPKGRTEKTFVSVDKTDTADTAETVSEKDKGNLSIETNDPKITVQWLSHQPFADVDEGIVELRAQLLDSVENMTATWFVGDREVCPSSEAKSGLFSCKAPLDAGVQTVFLEIIGANYGSLSELPLNVQHTATPYGEILFPRENTTLHSETDILLKGITADLQDKPQTLVTSWVSDKDGLLGQSNPDRRGESELLTRLSTGNHQISLHVEDSQGNTHRYETAIKVITDSANHKTAALISAEKSDFQNEVDRVYQLLGSSPLFIKNLKPNKRAKALLKAVEKLNKHGISRKDFNLGFSKKNDKGITLVPANHEVAAKLDRRLTAALVRYVYEFRFRRWAHAAEVTSSRYIQLNSKAIAETAALAYENLVDGIEYLWPKTTDYKRLIKALADYETYRAEKPKRYGWKDWKKAKSKKERDPLPFANIVSDLQRRLQIDGYYKGEISGAFDEKMQAAIHAFEANSEIKKSEDLRKDTFQKISPKLGHRIQKLKLNLQRSRESIPNRQGTKTYIKINIPNFNLKLIEDEVVTRQHKVIVGSNKLDFDRNQWTQGHLNRTSMLESRLVSVVVNPEWRPPQRILDEAFNGRKGVVVPPGPKNPLGYAKFILHRSNAIFLHDTNRRKLFKNQYRAYSHGCIRVENAVGLAKHLAQNFSLVDHSRYERYEKDVNTQMSLKSQKTLQVFVEYNTIAVDEKGQLVFGRDPYNYDSDLLSNQRPIEEVRYGHTKMRPKAVPIIPSTEYENAKELFTKAPMTWPAVPEDAQEEKKGP